MRTTTHIVPRNKAVLICDGCLKYIKTKDIVIIQRLNRVDVPKVVYLTCKDDICVQEVLEK